PFWVAFVQNWAILANFGPFWAFWAHFLHAGHISRIWDELGQKGMVQCVGNWSEMGKKCKIRANLVKNRGIWSFLVVFGRFWSISVDFGQNQASHVKDRGRASPLRPTFAKSASRPILDESPKL
ncbi:MAG: hypothetical protein GY900_12070, partial [Actinomycetia bacterium]|nr:hypothetical protein [Actinomycetes bacterium]